MANGTNVPSPTFTATGFVAPATAQVLVGVQVDINSAFGGNLNFAPSTPQGQLATSQAAAISNVNATFILYTQLFDPAYSFGRYQDALGRIYFLERDPAEPTTLQVACVGAQGVPIPDGTGVSPAATIKDASGNIYACTAGVTIPSGGTITTTFACTAPGPVAVPASNGIEILQAIPGWDSVTVVSGVQGVNTESRQAFEQRRQDSVAGNSFGAIGSIIGAVAKVAGVTDYFGYDNVNAAPATIAGVTVAAKSIFVCVAGGAPQDVANAIWSKKAPGCGYTGTTTETVFDENPLYASPIPYTVSFQIAAPLQFLFAVTIVSSPQVPSNAATLIQSALIAAVTQGVIQGNPQIVPGVRARIGQAVYATTYIQAINALGTWAQVASIKIGSANTPGAVVVGSISGNNFTVSSVTSGTLAVGQTLSDTTGIIANATQIVSQTSGSPGGIGVYIVNNPQTVAGASFTGNGSGTNLTASSVTGVIVIGDVISGTGVPGGTTIVSQTSGSPGGAGVYVTSGATTSSGATITTSEIVSASSANQDLVAVQANQEPQLVAADIAVSTT